MCETDRKTEKATLRENPWRVAFFFLAEPTGLEPATSDVTGRRSNQLNYDSVSLFFLRFHVRIACPIPFVVGGTGFEPVTPGL